MYIEVLLECITVLYISHRSVCTNYIIDSKANHFFTDPISSWCALFFYLRSNTLKFLLCIRYLFRAHFENIGDLLRSRYLFSCQVLLKYFLMSFAKVLLHKKHGFEQYSMYNHETYNIKRFGILHHQHQGWVLQKNVSSVSHRIRNIDEVNLIAFSHNTNLDRKIKFISNYKATCNR